MVGVRQFVTVLEQQLVDFGRIRVIGFLAILAQALAQALGENAKQCIGKIEGSIPISSRRMMDSGAELVCRVAKTR